jgi:hypothetical protein
VVVLASDAGRWATASLTEVSYGGYPPPR